MKRYLNRRFATAFAGTIATYTCGMIISCMIIGEFQQIVKFAGVGEEIVFTLFVAGIGFVSLALTLSTVTSKK